MKKAFPFTAWTLSSRSIFFQTSAEALKSAGAAFVEEAHEGGVRVGTWVVDEAAEMELLFGWGVDAVATNDPATAVAVRHGRLGA